MNSPQRDAGTGLDGGVPRDGGVVVSCDEAPPERTLEMIASSYEGATIVDEAHDLMIGLPRHLDDAIVGLSAVSLAMDEERTIALDVDASTPLVQVIDAHYDRAAGRSVVLAYEQTGPGDGSIGPKLQLLTLEVDATNHARLVRLQPTDAPDVMGPAFTSVYPEGDGVHYRAFRWEASARATVSGDTVSWEPEVMITADGFFDGNQISFDPAGARLIVFGETEFTGTPPNFTERFVPSVFELPIAGGTHWSRVPAGGQAPPTVESNSVLIVGYEHFYDDIEQRLVVLMDHEVPDPFGGMKPYFVTGGWAFESGQWSEVSDDLGFCCATGGYGVEDHPRQRVLVPSGGGTDFAPSREGQRVSLDIGVPPSPWLDAIAFDSTRGAILGATESAVAVMDVRKGDFAWRPLVDTPVRRPNDSNQAYVIVVDEGRIVSFGGTTISGATTVGTVHVLDPAADMPAWTVAPTTGPVHDGHLYAGVWHDRGTRTLFLASGQNSRRVSALDLATMTWRTIGDLPEERLYSQVRSVDATTIEVAFGAVGADTKAAMSGFLVDTTTGDVTPTTYGGDTPDIEVGGVTALPLECGWLLTVATSQNMTLYEERGGAFAKRTLSRDPRSAWSRWAVSDPESGAAYTVGRSVWRFR